ncbi:MAG: 50S ribosomal protein L14e [Candidatus Methanofastidiosia archaeon]|jgi:large subunit ribosomal protein L14e
MVMKVGRVCTKLSGREAGNICAVVNVMDRSFVVVTGPHVRRRKCNIKHLEPHATVITIEKNASDEEVLKALEGEGLV